MAAASATFVHYNPRNMSKRTVTGETNKTNPHTDLHEVTVLPITEWRRIQDSANRMDKQRQRLIDASRQREAMHLHSKEVVKNWSNTIAGQQQRRLAARKIRDEIEEEKRKQFDIEEAMIQEEKRKEAIERAKTLQYYQTDRVKRFHSALRMTEVLKEREAQIELKQRKEEVTKGIDKEFINMARDRETLALQQEQLKALEKMQNCLLVAECVKEQIKEHEQAKKDEIAQRKKEEEELKRFQELYLNDQIALKQKKLEKKKDIIKTYQEHIDKKKIIQADEDKKNQLEEERRRLYLEVQNEMMKLRKEQKEERIREVQRHKEALAKKHKPYYRVHVLNDEAIISKAAAETEAKQDKQQREKDEKKEAMLKSIAEYREKVQKETECKKQEENQNAIEMLNMLKKMDTDFRQKQLIKARERKESKILQDAHNLQMAEKHANEQTTKKIESRNEELFSEDDDRFQKYAKQVIQKASENKRITSLLHKAAV